MNFNLAAQVTLILSSIGLGRIIYTKIPVLSGLSEDSSLEEDSFWIKAQQKFKEKNPLREIDLKEFLMNVLKKVRIFFLKTDDKIFGWTQKLKEDSQKKKIKEDGDYWDKIKNNTKE